MRWLSWHHIRQYTNEVVAVGIAATIFIVVAKAAVNSSLAARLGQGPAGVVVGPVAEVINRT